MLFKRTLTITLCVLSTLTFSAKAIPSIQKQIRFVQECEPEANTLRTEIEETVANDNLPLRKRVIKLEELLKEARTLKTSFNEYFEEIESDLELEGLAPNSDPDLEEFYTSVVDEESDSAQEADPQLVELFTNLKSAMSELLETIASLANDYYEKELKKYQRWFTEKALAGVNESLAALKKAPTKTNGKSKRVDRASRSPETLEKLDVRFSPLRGNKISSPKSEPPTSVINSFPSLRRSYR